MDGVREARTARPRPNSHVGNREPPGGLEAALDDVTRQVEEYGAKAFKFYNVRYEDGGQVPWRMDDPKVAFPVFERIQELGVNLIGVHKGVPLGPQMIEHTQTWDMDGAAGAFPDINFVIYHVGLPFIDETCWQLIRYPNLYASLAATINFVVRAPRQFAEILGKLLFWCGEDKIIYGSEAPIWQPQWALEAFWNFQIPQDLTDGYGYPQLTEQAKRKILGENLLRLHGMDVDADPGPTRRELIPTRLRIADLPLLSANRVAPRWDPSPRSVIGGRVRRVVDLERGAGVCDEDDEQRGRLRAAGVLGEQVVCAGLFDPVVPLVVGACCFSGEPASDRSVENVRVHERVAVTMWDGMCGRTGNRRSPT